MIKIVAASMSDCDQIRTLIRQSVYGLSQNDYTEQDIASALTSIWGLDTQLIKDQTYFLVYLDGQLAACGGWSFRQTLFGSDSQSDRNPARLDPNVDAARIRAFFVHPDFARRGIGSRLLEHCEEAAVSYGFSKLSLGATLPGKRLYERHGFVPEAIVQYTLNNGSAMDVIPMRKDLHS